MCRKMRMFCGVMSSSILRFRHPLSALSTILIPTPKALLKRFTYEPLLTSFPHNGFLLKKTMDKIFIRIVAFIITFGLFVNLPWWISVLWLAGLTIYFPLYLEVLFFCFLFDTLYLPRYEFPYTALSVAFVFLLLVYFIRTRIRT